MSPSISEAVGAETASYTSAALPPSLPPQVSTEHPLWATQVHTDTSSVFRRSEEEAFLSEPLLEPQLAGRHLVLKWRLGRDGGGRWGDTWMGGAGARPHGLLGSESEAAPEGASCLDSSRGRSCGRQWPSQQPPPSVVHQVAPQTLPPSITPKNKGAGGMLLPTL